MMESHARAGEPGTEILCLDGAVVEFDPEDARRARRLTL